MTIKRAAVTVLLLTLVVAPAAGFARGFGGGGFSGGDRGGGGFDFHGEDGGGFSHSSTGPAGTSRTTTASEGGGGATRTTTATNGDATRQSTGSVNENGNYQHNSTGSDAYGSHSSMTAGNTQTGNYTHSGTGSNPYGSYSDSGSGNSHNGTYYGTGTATNQYGTTYHTATSMNDGVVYHGATVGNPMYYGYPAYGWNAGVAWYPAPIYYGGAFWGAYAIGAATAVAYGSIVAANNVTITSYQVTPQSPGAKLLASYQLTQVPCGPPDLVVIYGPNNSATCARPNQLVAAGSYSVDPSTLSLVSQAPSTAAAGVVPPVSIAGSGSPLMAMQAGASRNYRVTSQTVSPDGNSSNNHSVRIARSGPTQFLVSVDGGANIDVNTGPGGNVSELPAATKTALAPFIQMSLLMHAAPQPVAASSAWGATIPVVVKPDTDTVPVSVSISRFGPTGATVSAAGQTNSDAKPGVRTFPATISVNATLFFDQNHQLGQSNGSVTVELHQRGGRSKKVINTWTVTAS